jgi:ubiquinone/menaquinone biosynthesis C-methylase UbiE
MLRTDSTARFSNRVANYIRYRPGYPAEVLEVLRKLCQLTPQSIIADIACGTGIFTRMLLENGNRVFGVEPNREMREAAERLLAKYPKFTSIAGTAEETTLTDRSVDFATAAQAAHWFDLSRARREFARILTPEGWAVLIWNERNTDTTPFLRAYEQLLMNYGTDYQQVRHENTTAKLDSFFASAPFQERVFDMTQKFDYPELEGRLLSSSYAPLENNANYASMLAELRSIFELHQVDGRISMDYRTRMYYGRFV